MKLFNQLWNDEFGFVASSELLLIATILVLGMVVGLSAIRDSIVQELGDFAAAIGSMNQSYSFSAVQGHHSDTAGSSFNDKTDSCETAGHHGRGGNDSAGRPPVCIQICNVDATQEGSRRRGHRGGGRP